MLESGRLGEWECTYILLDKFSLDRWSKKFWDDALQVGIYSWKYRTRSIGEWVGLK